MKIEENVEENTFEKEKRRKGDMTKDELEWKIMETKKRINEQVEKNKKALAKQVWAEAMINNLKSSKVEATTLKEKFDVEAERDLKRRADPSSIPTKGTKAKTL